jgi:hypothetical protein
VVNATSWRRSGEGFVVEWGGRDWTLDPSGGRPGLRSTDDATHGILELSGLAATNRRSDAAFDPSALVGVELLHSRVLATYAPAGWNGLTVRAAWGPSPDGDGVDLEVQASTTTVGELRRLEILVRSSWADGPAGPATIEPRDRPSALLSYDGREEDDLLYRATTAPVPAPGSAAFAPLFVPSHSTGITPAYVEMVHPNDASRRLVELVVRPDGRPTIASARYALFGHDLEKGVVLRGRFRGVWLAESGDVEAHRLRFMNEPPPLGN